ncbi:MAG: FMN-binding protein [Lachnospiraceae bacterium]|nr:FMN-binding protein [Lachnospiraceae bacterium]
MKYKNFTVRFLSLAVIAGALFSYNSVAAERRLMVEKNENKISEAEAYNESIMALESAEGVSSGENTGIEAGRSVYADGVWEGTGMGFGGDINVAVTVESGKITHVEILSAKSEDSAYLKMAEELTDHIVEEQNTEIDTISGATYSSRGILGAASDALSKAVSP